MKIIKNVNTRLKKGIKKGLWVKSPVIPKMKGYTNIGFRKIRNVRPIGKVKYEFTYKKANKRFKRGMK